MWYHCIKLLLRWSLLGIASAVPMLAKIQDGPNVQNTHLNPYLSGGAVFCLMLSSFGPDQDKAKSHQRHNCSLQKKSATYIAIE